MNFNPNTIMKQKIQQMISQRFGSVDNMMNDMSKFAGNNPTLKNALDLYKKGEIDELYICYTEFISPLTQTPKLMKVLPLAFDKEEGKSKDNSGSRARVQYLPSPEAVLSYLIPKYVSGVVYDGVIESFASEQSARRNAMKSASDNADEMLSTLELSYNRARQTAVTQEITEIVGGVEALK